MPVTVRSSPPLSCNTTDPPDNPDTEPPTEKVGTAAQMTATLVTFAEPMVPEPFATLQVCPAGFVFTDTA